MDRDRDSADASIRPPWPAEALLIDHWAQFAAERVLCTSLGDGQLAQRAAADGARVDCWFLDRYRADLAEGALSCAAPSVNVLCQPDFPVADYDRVVLPTSAHGEAELTRDLLQAGYQRLVDGGRLIVSTDNPRDRWLAEELRKLSPRLRRIDDPRGVLYLVLKDRPLKRVRDFTCEFVFRDGPRLLHVLSRPGVFSHRELDSGARQLIQRLELQPKSRVLDIGCGSGGVALAAAARDAEVDVLAIDSNARAVACCRSGAERNGLANVAVELNASGDYPGAGTFDLALANPPYYAQFRIAALFVRAAQRALRPGGSLLLVTKSPDWYAEHLPEAWDLLALEVARSYTVVRAVKRG